MIIWNALLVLVIISPKNSFSKEITEKFVRKFQEDIEEFKKASAENVFKDGIFDPSKYDEHAAIKNAEVYDFIIVGAGPAGSAIANRLSEIPEWKILLLEAGGLESIYTQVPVHSGFLQGSKYNWGYLTEPQTTCCLGMLDRQCTAPTGKGLGGATIINGMIYTRGNARDYDLWAAQGNDGWRYKDVLPYFKKAEDCALPKFDGEYHGRGGPVFVEESQYVSPLRETFLAAGKELGYKIVDYNGRQQTGFGTTQATTKHGKRHSASEAYLFPYQNRRNLRIKLLSQVIQILFRTHTKEAFGVKYIRNETMYIAKAAKEVIVSAGPFNSPQLLMLSGIGPREDLDKLQIPVIEDLQVGRHLKDHAGFQGPNFILNISQFEEPSMYDQLLTWLTDGKGPLSSAGAQALAFVQTDPDRIQTDHPDVELVLSRPSFSKNLRIKKEYRSVIEPTGKYASFRISVMPTRPKSIGTVKLKSKDPFHGPVINSNFFSDPEGRDIKNMVAGIKIAIKLIETSAFRKLGARLYSEPVKDCEHFGFGSDDYWKCAARYVSISLRHQIGTCKMGPHNDKNAVVDDKLRVYGVHKLRVADSSVIPVAITGHTHAAANMLGEKAADLIKKYWQPF